ncbi:hypothetical protein CON39_11330 [Bacillus thuringiensis]|uniref:hypothetical protein n=1 Tax=Bacillus thuringiensis TaxID=1428 RepID=UPI000BEDAFBA|nr:hypothetical protein [Bacillus thuringiensis]PEF30275.1 hypothetical protein CON39_11330 [Bacillus thuringiensis]HDX9663372.1 hypothetical protein [Bacillus cereus]
MEKHKYYSIARGRYRYTRSGNPKFETDSGLVARGYDVPDMLANVGKAHPSFFHMYDGITWTEIDKEQADILCGKDCDKIFDKEYGLTT